MTIYKYYEIEIGELPSLNTKKINMAKPINYSNLPTKEIIKKTLKLVDNRMKAINYSYKVQVVLKRKH